MDNQELQKFIGNEKMTVLEAMQMIDNNSSGIMFLADMKGSLIGCVTDGDIRRYLLSGGLMTGAALEAANRNPKVAKTVDEARHLYHKKKYIVIPIVDDEGVVIDLYSSENGDTEKKQHNPLNIPVVINAGGKGTRLDPYTRVLPKPLIPVGELPIIEHIMQRFQGYSCNEFHIIVNYKKEIMKGYFAENEGKYNISWYDEEKPLGTGGGLTLLKGKMQETFFFTNCDNLLLSNYDSIIRFHKEQHNVITMICAYKNLQIPYGVVEMGLNGAIEEMKEKPQLSFLTNTGIYVVEPEVLEDMDDGVPIGFPDVVEKQKAKGRNMTIYPVSENDWLDMGQLPELDNMRRRLYGE